MILILSLIFIILFHELGHLIVAKLCGCKVNIFSVGFGKPFFAKKFGETTYQIAPILLGGYCALDSELTLSDSLNAFTNKRYTQKVFISLAGIFVNVVTGFSACMIGHWFHNFPIFAFGYYSILIGLSNGIPIPALDGSYPIIFLFEKLWGKEKTYRIWGNIVAEFFKWLMILNILSLPYLGYLLYTKKIM